MRRSGALHFDSSLDFSLVSLKERAGGHSRWVLGHRRVPVTSGGGLNCLGLCGVGGGRVGHVYIYV